MASLSFGGLRCNFAKTTSPKKNHAPMRKVTLFISSAQNSCERTIITWDTMVSGPSGALLSTLWLRKPLENWKTLPGTFDVNTSGGFSSEPVQVLTPNGIFQHSLLKQQPKIQHYGLLKVTRVWKKPTLPGLLQKRLGPGRFHPWRPLNSKLAALDREEDVVIGPGKQMGREAPLKRKNRSEAFCLDLIQADIL